MKMTVTDKMKVDVMGVAGTDNTIENAKIIFKVHAPVFVFREFIKHYSDIVFTEKPIDGSILEPLFYIPPLDSGFSKGDMRLYTGAHQTIAGSYEISWTAYMTLIDEGISAEVAGLCLPTSIYSTALVTMGVKALNAFLLESNLTYENQILCKLMEKHFEKHFPIAYNSYVQSKGDS